MADRPNPFESPKSSGVPGSSMAEGKRHRSRFWIVSTHVLTTGFVMPLLAFLLAQGVLYETNLRGGLAFLVVLVFQAVGYIAGTYYSLSYLRKTTAIGDPEACTQASVTTFAVLALLAFVANIAMLKGGNAIEWILWIIFYLVISWAFAKITRKGFAAMAVDLREVNQEPGNLDSKRAMVKFSNGELSLWIEQESSIRIKVVTKRGDPVDLRENQAGELANTLIKMAGLLRKDV